MRPLAAALFALTCASWTPAAPPGAALAAGDVVPPMKVKTLDGKAAEVSWDAAKLTLVNFWATWCAPCRQEMPELQKLATARKKKLRVVGVVVMDQASAPEIASAAAVAQARYEIFWGGPPVEAAWHGIGILPTTYLVDPKGAIVRKYVGTSPEMLTAVRKDVEDFLGGRPLGDPYVPEE
jgi:thiol-disulfide isomerase/thioredoxin